MTFAGSNSSRLRNQAESACARSSGGNRLPIPCPRSRPPGSSSAARFRLPLGVRRLHHVEYVALLLEDQIRAGPARRGDENERAIFFSRAAASMRDRPAFAVPGDRDAARIHVVRAPPAIDGRAQVVSVVLERDAARCVRRSGRRRVCRSGER